jgi:hypothetical protein
MVEPKAALVCEVSSAFVAEHPTAPRADNVAAETTREAASSFIAISTRKEGG